jgi:peptide/nickel transport system substrate-binding protein
MTSLRAFAAMLACALAFAACSQTQQPAAGRTNPWTVPGVLRLGEPDEPDNLNPMFGHTEATDRADALLFSFLLRYDDNGEYIPDLAIEVPSLENGGISADGKTITVHLRKGVQWSDGVPLTARDWLFTYHAVMNPRNNTKLLYLWDDIASVHVLDDQTIVIRLKQSNAGFLGVLAMGGSAYPPLPEHLLGKLPDINRASFNDTPISSGPFLLSAWNHGSSLVFVPNPHYFRGAPKLKKIVWKVIPDNNTLFSQLQTHEIDVYPTVNEEAIPRLASIRGITVNRKLIASWRHLGFNTHKPLLADVRVRRAIAEAIDWTRINNTVYRGYNQLGVSDIFPGSWAAPKLPPYPYNPADARALLREAGWTMGSDGDLHRGDQTMELTISTGTNKAENQQAEVVMQSMLRPFGVALQIRNYPISLLFAQDGPIYSGKYDLEWSVETNGPDPDNSGSWNGEYIPPKGANTSWLNDPEINRLSDAAIRTYDRAKRKALYQREEVLIRELMPAVAFYWENSYTAYNSDLQNYKPAAFITDMWNAWEWSI